jgi:NADH dehydrogenase
VSASPLGRDLAEQSDVELDRAGRVRVLSDLSIPGYPNVFVVGDMAAVEGVPGMAQGAIQGAKYVANAIKGELKGADPAAREPFHYFDKGSMATISRFRAVALIGKLRLTGFVAWLLWLGVHLMYLTGFKNRLTALLHWAVSFVGRGRSERTATEQQLFARQAITRLDGGTARLVSNPVRDDAAAAAAAARRRQELEEQALAEIRLTDSGERGQPVR